MAVAAAAASPNPVLTRTSTPTPTPTRTPILAPTLVLTPTLTAQTSEEELQESAALCRTFDGLERGALGPLQFRKLMALLDEQNGWIHSAIQARPSAAP